MSCPGLRFEQFFLAPQGRYNPTSYMPESKTLVRGGRRDRLAQDPKKHPEPPKPGPSRWRWARDRHGRRRARCGARPDSYTRPGKPQSGGLSDARQLVRAAATLFKRKQGGCRLRRCSAPRGTMVLGRINFMSGRSMQILVQQLAERRPAYTCDSMVEA